jgi:hypothetical protein
MTVVLVAQKPARLQPSDCGGLKMAAEHGRPAGNALQFILLTQPIQPIEFANDVNHDWKTIFTMGAHVQP